MVQPFDRGGGEEKNVEWPVIPKSETVRGAGKVGLTAGTAVASVYLVYNWNVRRGREGQSTSRRGKRAFASTA